MIFRLIISATALIASAGHAAEANWPGFRGPGGQGIASNCPETWSATENIVWKTNIPGRGWSSPIVAGDLVFVTTAVSSGDEESPKKGLYFGGERPDAPLVEHQWKVIALDLGSGAVKWDTIVHKGPPANPIHIKNSYASETPVTDGKFVYAAFGGLGIYCLDLDGKVIWEYKLPPVTMRYGWGTAASPALHGGRLYYVSDNDEASYLLALDAATGAEIWKTPRDEKSNWSPPFVWENGTRTEIVTAGTGANRSYDLDGKELWRLRGMSSITIAMPYAADGLLYLSSGYVGDKMKAVYAVKPGASGDISLVEPESSNDYIAWSSTTIAPYNPSTLVYDGLLYILYDRGTVSCFDAKTGDVVYEKQKLQGSGGFTVSPWAANGRIYCLDEDGKCFVLKAGKTFELLQTNTLGEDDMAMATPAMVNGKLILRTAAGVHCITAK